MRTGHPVSRRRKREGGFVLVFVFLMAAMVAIMMFMQLPRVAFESQRDKEQLLVDRGEQFKRAIQVYYIKTKKFPQRIEDLENTNGVRFLRRRYIDPMTGKDEWRIIHVNGAGLLTDSLVQKPPGLDPSKSKDKDKDAAAAAAATDANDINPLARQRATNQQAGMGGQQPAQPVDPNAPPSSFADPNAPQTPTDARYMPPGQVPPNGQLPTGQVPPNGQLPTGQQGIPGQPANGVPQVFQPGQIPPNGIAGGIQPGLSGGFPAGGQPPFGSAGGQVPNPAINLINQIITQPRQNPNGPTPVGFSGVPQAGGPPLPGSQPPGGLPFQSPGQQPGTQPNQQGQFGAGGIAGFASTYSGTGIKVYKERKKYQEWEFVFDLKELLGQQNRGAANNNQRPNNAPGGGPSPAGGPGSNVPPPAPRP